MTMQGAVTFIEPLQGVEPTRAVGEAELLRADRRRCGRAPAPTISAENADRSTAAVAYIGANFSIGDGNSRR